MSAPFAIPLLEKINPDHTALVVIDYQNDFVADGGAFSQSGAEVHYMQEIAPALQSLVENARLVSVPVIFVQSAYTTDDNRYLSRVFLHQKYRERTGRYHDVPVCQPGSWGWDFYGQLRPTTGEPVVTKHRFSAFVNTDLDILLRSRGIQTIIATGVTTECCVESTVRDAFFRDYFVVVPRECAASFGPQIHDPALERMNLLFGEVSPLEEILGAWKARERLEPVKS